MTNGTLGFCERCLDGKPYIVNKKSITEVVNGHEITYLCQVVYCAECNSPIRISRILDENLDKMSENIGEALDIITVDEIKAILEKYDIGKGSLSLLLGWGGLTIIRYLEGTVPLKNSSDRLRKILESPSEMVILLEENKGNISSETFKRTLVRAQELMRNETSSY